jgi:hypothetical protein
MSAYFTLIFHNNVRLYSCQFYRNVPVGETETDDLLTLEVQRFVRFVLWAIKAHEIF